MTLNRFNLVLTLLCLYSAAGVAQTMAAGPAQNAAKPATPASAKPKYPMYWPPALNTYYPDIEMMSIAGKPVRL